MINFEFRSKSLSSIDQIVKYEIKTKLREKKFARLFARAQRFESLRYDLKNFRPAQHFQIKNR